jgi:hypothetical protein
MRILAVRQPWASLIIHGGIARNGKVTKKDIENRPRLTHIRGRIAIQASKTRTGVANEIEYAKRTYGVTVDPETLVYGAVIGSVDLVDCVSNSKSKWHEEGAWGYVRKDPLAYPKPIPCSGQLGFFTRDDIAKKLARFERILS